MSWNRSINTFLQFGVLPKMKESDREKLLRKREKQKAKDDSKIEKQRRLKEEKLRKVADKEKERDKKKQQKIKQKAVSLGSAPSKLSDFIQVRGQRAKAGSYLIISDK